jgi:acid stress-induced BolA-like protein IbaG/YrbA
MIPAAEVKKMLEQAFPGDHIELASGDDHHFQLLIVSERFAGRTPVEQHQMVYRALGGAMREDIHAMSLRTYTPEQWRKLHGPE